MYACVYVCMYVCLFFLCGGPSTEFSLPRATCSVNRAAVEPQHCVGHLFSLGCALTFAGVCDRKRSFCPSAVPSAVQHPTWATGPKGLGEEWANLCFGFCNPRCRASRPDVAVAKSESLLYCAGPSSSSSLSGHPAFSQFRS